jgi:hypothetical protein
MRAAAPWLPLVPVVVMTALAVIEAMLLPLDGRARRRWVGGVVVAGSLAVASAFWLQQASESTLAREGAQLQSFFARLEKMNGLLSQKEQASPDGIFDAVVATIDDLHKKVAELRARITELGKAYKDRTIDAAVASEMIGFLRQSGSHHVVISCAPDDVEAYDYGNQIANILKAAQWDASGPEATAIFGTAPAMGVSLFTRGPTVPAGATILLQAFAKFNIPYQARIGPDDALPDADTVELYIPRKP